jgi:hypothetical protein
VFKVLKPISRFETDLLRIDANASAKLWLCGGVFLFLSLCVVAVTMLKIVCVPNRTIIIGWWNLNARCGAVNQQTITGFQYTKNIVFF